MSDETDNTDQVPFNALAYGPVVGEYHHDAMYGPEGNQLGPNDVALSPNRLQEFPLGSQVEATDVDGNVIGTYNVADESYYHPGQPTHDTVEFRDRDISHQKVFLRPANQVPSLAEAMSVPASGLLNPSPLASVGLPSGDAAVPAVAHAGVQTAPGPLQYSQLLTDGEDTGTSPADVGSLADVGADTSDSSDAAAGTSLAISAANEPDTAAPATTSQEETAYPPVAHPDGLQVDNQSPDGSWVKFNDGTVLDRRDNSINYKDTNGATWKWIKGQTKPIKISGGAKAPVLKTNPLNGKMYDVSDPANPKEVNFPQSASDLQAGARGEDALKGLSPGEQDQVKALTDYRMNIAAIPARGLERQRLLERAYAYDPTFDMSNYANRQKVMQSFKSGKNADNIKSINTAVNHLQELSDAVDQLGNRGDKLSNLIVNTAKDVSGNPAITKFNTTATAVENELANVFKNTGATEGEIHQWRSNFSKYGSPAQLKEGINEAIRLMSGRMDALTNTYQEGIGKPKDFDILSPQSKKILSKLGAGDVVAQDATASGNAPSAAAPAQTSPQLEVGKIYPDAQGNRARYLGNGHWQTL